MESLACAWPRGKRRERKLTEATALAPNVTECYFEVTLHPFYAILRSDELWMVFYGNGDLSML